MQNAWQIERNIRQSAVPFDRRIHPSDWFDPLALTQAHDMLLKIFWDEKVPGSGAPEHAYLEMMQAWENQGYDVSEAVNLFSLGLEFLRAGDLIALRALTAQLLEAVFNAPKIQDHPYHTYQHPKKWEEVRKAMGNVNMSNYAASISDFQKKILDGWLGQLAGASFGTAIEGYTGKNIKKVYGEVESYITQPETMNDDVVYELIFLDVFQKKLRQITSRDIAIEWLKQIPFAWSAEWITLQNLRMGIFPPLSGSYRNPFSNWIGVQMRAMICGMLAPAWPIEAARLAHLDGIVSHSANGVYGGIFAAVMTSLAFIEKDPRKLLSDTLDYIPQHSEYKAQLDFALGTVNQNSDPSTAWILMDEHFQHYNWIHAYPNMAADVLALWYGGGDLTRSFNLLAHAGLDVDCNGGLVGNILGIINGVEEKWSAPLGDLLETYLPGKERLSIRELARTTAELAVS